MRIGISCYSTFGGRGPVREPQVSGSTGLPCIERNAFSRSLGLADTGTLVLCDMGVGGGAAGSAANYERS